MRRQSLSTWQHSTPSGDNTIQTKIIALSIKLQIEHLDCLLSSFFATFSTINAFPASVNYFLI